jgi:hypothetical protein
MIGNCGFAENRMQNCGGAEDVRIMTFLGHCRIVGYAAGREDSSWFG